MTNYREILRLSCLGLNKAQIAGTCVEDIAYDKARKLDKAQIARLGIVKKCAVEKNPKSEIDRYQAAG